MSNALAEDTNNDIKSQLISKPKSLVNHHEESSSSEEEEAQGSVSSLQGIHNQDDGLVSTFNDTSAQIHSANIIKEHVSIYLGEIDETEVLLSDDDDDDDDDDDAEEDIDNRARELAGLLLLFPNNKDENTYPLTTDVQNRPQNSDVHNKRSLSSRLVSTLRASFQKDEPLKRVSQSVSRVRLSLRQSTRR